MTKPAPHSRALRQGRVSELGRAYHIRTSTHEREPVFSDYRLGRLVIASLRFLHDRGDVQSLAFVVMPDHLHWLFVLQRSRSLDRVVAALKRQSAREINRRLGRSGRCLWQAGYFDRAIRAEEDLRTIARYIVANPLRAGLCASLCDYPLWDAAWL